MSLQLLGQLPIMDYNLLNVAAVVISSLLSFWAGRVKDKRRHDVDIINMQQGFIEKLNQNSERVEKELRAIEYELDNLKKENFNLKTSLAEMQLKYSSYKSRFEVLEVENKELKQALSKIKELQ